MSAPCVISEGTVIEDFSDAAQWTPDANIWGALSLNQMSLLNDTKQSVQAKTVASTTSITGTITKTISLALDTLKNSMILDCYLYLDCLMDLYTSGAKVSVEFSSTTDFSKSFKYTVPYFMPGGWNRVIISQYDWVNTGAESWANTMVRLRIGVTPIVGTRARIVYDRLRAGVQMHPAVVFTLDDDFAAAYTTAFPKLTAVGAKGVLACVTDWVGLDGNYTVAQLQEMAAAGWEVCNHSKTHPWASLHNASYVAGDLEGAQAALRSWGVNEAPHNIIPASSYDDRILALYQQRGYLTNRVMCTSAAGNTVPPAQGVPLTLTGPQLVLGARLDSGISLANAKAWVDSIVSSGGSLIFLNHDLQAAASGATWAIADFEALVDYVVAAGIPIMTMAEWYAFVTDVAVGPCLNLGSLSLWDSDGYRLLPDIDMGAPQLAFGTATNYTGGVQTQIDIDRSALVPVHWQEEVTGATPAQLQSRVDALVAEVNKSLNTLVWSPAADIAAQTYTIVASQAPHIVYDNTVLLAYRAIVDIDLWRQP